MLSGRKEYKLSQEGLKLIACVSMLIDHIGAVFVPWDIFRVIGRLAFPIYCFLLAEGAHYTRNPTKYALRLGFGALLAELPYDLLFFGDITLRHHSVMVTLFLGYISLRLMKRTKNRILGILWVIPFALLAELLGADYGGSGILMISMFGFTRDLPYSRLFQTLGLFFFMDISSYTITVGSLAVPMQFFAVFSMISISAYSGRKSASSKAIQRAFYLFYPLHLLVLYFIKIMV